MKNFVRLLIAASVALAVFSIAYAREYASVRDKYAGVALRDELVAAAEDSIHATVKIVSIPYFLLCIGAFSVAMRRDQGRVVPIVGIVICLVMVGWSAILSRGVSFDEVYLAWIAAAIILAGLLLTLLGAAGRGPRAPS